MDEAPGRGLTTEQARLRLEQHGPNELFHAEPPRFLHIAREEVTEPMILLLLGVGVVYSLWGRVEDAVTIFAVIFLLVLAEVTNEYRAKRAIDALQRLTAPKANVLRDGTPVMVDADSVVVDDVLVLVSGSRISADATILCSRGISMDESAITGESFPVDKAEGDEVYAGTVALSGEAETLVTATGTATRLGGIATGLKKVKPPKTPLQLAMRSLAGKLVYVALGFSLLIPAIGLLRGGELREMVLTGLSLAFATIPEELPIIITMVLGLGSYRLSRRGFLVKRLVAAETMGDTTVIVTDKTGTITEGRMGIERTWPAQRSNEVLAAALAAVAPFEDTPVDVAVRAKALGEGLPAEERPIARERELGERGPTKAIARGDELGAVLYVSGAPEAVFAACADVPDEALRQIETDTAAGFRLVAVASKPLGPGWMDAPLEQSEHDLGLVGLLVFSDPPRTDVAETIRVAFDAGIYTIMVTGDHPATAATIARQVGILDVDGSVLTGADVDAMDDSELREAVRAVTVFARATPQHKYRLVEALQAEGEVVAVTGDGINDALALRAADIGIAMGRRGTDVAREAADVVLAEDDYDTIANGVFEGRTFRDNLRKGVKYYLSVKLALIAIFLLPVLAGLPLPFSPIQIILVELFMDLAASAGFVAEPHERDVYRRRPAQRDHTLFDAVQIRDIAFKSSLLFVTVIVTLLVARAQGLSEAEVRTLTFSAWMFGHVALAFVSRSDHEPLASVGVFGNRIIDLWGVAAASLLLAGVFVPAIGEPLGLVAVPLSQLVMVALFAVAVVGLAEVRKAMRWERRRQVHGFPSQAPRI